MRSTAELWRRLGMAIVCIAVSFILCGCSVQSYAVGRAVRHFTGATTRFHPIVPLNGALARYQVIEVKKLDNLVLDQIPPPMVTYIDDKIIKELQAIRSKPEIVEASNDCASEDENAAEVPPPTLILEGDIDDYNAGYVGLRLVELGFNHVAVTVRFQLRDKRTGEIVGAASITSQDNRVTATTKTAINRIAKRIKGFVSAGYGGVGR